MNRRDFGPWGIELNDDDFACALAAAAVLASHKRWPIAPYLREDDRERAVRDLAAALSVPGGMVSCDMGLWFDARELVASFDAGLLASAWRQVCDYRSVRLELDWVWFDALWLHRRGAFWLAQQLMRRAVGITAVHWHQEEPDADVCWSWPLRVGFLSDPESDSLRREIAGARRHPALTEIVTVPAPGVECDLLILPFDLRRGLVSVMQAEVPLRASCTVVLGGQGRTDASVESRVLSLRAEARSAGVAVTRVEAAKRAYWLNALVDDLAHGTWLDVAFTRACRESGARAPFLVASRRLLELAHVSVTGDSLTRDLGLADDDRQVPLGALTDRSRHRLQLDMFSQQASASLLRERLATVLSSLKLDHEGGDATTLAELARAYQSAGSPGSRPVRHLQAQLFDLVDDKRPRAALRAGGRHRIDVRIGLDEETWAALDEPFPDDELPRRQSIHWLTIVLTDPRLMPEPQVATVMLPAEGNSGVAQFFVFAPGEGVDSMEARITVLHENRVLQSARLRAPLSLEPEMVAEHDRLTLEPETFVSMDLGNLGGRTPFDAALVINHAGGAPQATAIAGEYASLIALKDVAGFVAKIADRLSNVAWKEKDYVSLEGEGARSLFFFLATQGSLLHDAILSGTSAPVRDALRAARNLQIVAARDGDILPVELAYAFTAPAKGAKLCQRGFAALAERAAGFGAEGCPNGCHDGKPNVICPLGFWGLSRVIERQSDGILPLGATGADFGIRLAPGARRRIEILRSAVFASSSRVDAEVAGSSGCVLAALTQTTHNRTLTASTWESWIEHVKASPSLLALLVHTGEDEEAGAQFIEIGQEQKLLVSQVDHQYVHGDAPGYPVVLLVGCRTSLSDVEFQQFPVKFLRRGAALVLGTVATVLGRRAGPVTARLIQAIADMTARGDIPFGKALLATKQRLVSEGELMAMCLSAHGDADWILGAPK